MKKELYDERERLNPDGCELGREFMRLIKDFLEDASKEYKIHELQDLFTSELSVECARLKIYQMFDESKKER